MSSAKMVRHGAFLSSIMWRLLTVTAMPITSPFLSARKVWHGAFFVVILLALMKDLKVIFRLLAQLIYIHCAKAAVEVRVMSESASGHFECAQGLTGAGQAWQGRAGQVNQF